jgi:hypothetical protein
MSTAVYCPSRSENVNARLLLSRPITRGPSHEPARDGISGSVCELTNLGVIKDASNRICRTILISRMLNHCGALVQSRIDRRQICLQKLIDL